MKTISITIVATVPDNVKSYRLENAIRLAVTQHVVPDYSKDVPRVVFASVAEERKEEGK